MRSDQLHTAWSRKQQAKVISRWLHRMWRHLANASEQAYTQWSIKNATFYIWRQLWRTLTDFYRFRNKFYKRLQWNSLYQLISKRISRDKILNCPFALVHICDSVKSRPISTTVAQTKLKNKFLKRDTHWLTYYLLLMTSLFAMNDAIHAVNEWMLGLAACVDAEGGTF